MKHPLPILLLAVLLATAVLNGCRHQENILPGLDLASDKILIGISQNGLFRISLAALQDAGFEIETLAEDNLYLSQGGTAVPYLIQDDNLIFYGQAADSRYTSIRPYLLETGRAGSLILSSSAKEDFPLQNRVIQTIHLEENLIYEATAITAANADPWFWSEIGRGQKVDIPLTLPETLAGSGKLAIQLWGKTHNDEVDNDHDLDVLMDGQQIETIVWDGNVPHLADIEIPASSLKPGDHVITLSNEAPGAAFLDIMNLNWMELTLETSPTAVGDILTFTTPADSAISLAGFSEEPIILNIQDPALPSQLLSDASEVQITENMIITAVGPDGFQQPTSLTLRRQSNWRNEENQADLIIISTDALIPALEPLVAAREDQGLSVAVVPITEIYDEFGFGEQSPESIRTFVTYAWQKWQDPRPDYLFLVGEATSDYLGYASNPPANHIPSPMVPVLFGGETVSDARLADVDGDLQPDLAVGRWPVDSPGEVTDLVARTLAYEAGTAVNNALFATDASESYFALMAERLWQNGNLEETAVTHLNGAQAKDVTSAWNKGTWLTTYLGHGSLELWGKDNIFNIEAVSDLEAGNPPIVVQLTCLTGLFAQPETEALAEVMLQHENGPVLIVAATSLTLSTSQEPFASELLKNLNDPAYERMGDAFQQAKRSLDIESSSALREISDTFILLGDPSTSIIRPVPPGDHG